MGCHCLLQQEVAVIIELRYDKRRIKSDLIKGKGMGTITGSMGESSPTSGRGEIEATSQKSPPKKEAAETAGKGTPNFNSMEELKKNFPELHKLIEHTILRQMQKSFDKSHSRMKKMMREG